MGCGECDLGRAAWIGSSELASVEGGLTGCGCTERSGVLYLCNLKAPRAGGGFGLDASNSFVGAVGLVWKALCERYSAPLGWPL
jgi:hypothetical protein